ncbi:hypothetical protein FACS1894199_10780 [Bacteroidia bacterium]|nr:hypothetical protein FACS1894199_10780 [Bacteroidia bacterium]
MQNKFIITNAYFENMKRFYFILLIIFCYGATTAGNIGGNDDEKNTLARQETYYLAYKKNTGESPAQRNAAVKLLVNGIADTNGGLVGQVLEYLQAFPITDFDTESQSIIIGHLTNPHTPHYEDLVLLAGYVGIGRDELNHQYFSQNESKNVSKNVSTMRKWNIALALARMGDKEKLNYCLQKIKKAPMNSNIVGYALPNLIYTRQKPALDYCVELLYSDEKLCRSPNPEISETINCAYRIIEQLAQVIVGFPIQVNPSIGLETDDYPKTLQFVRDWFKANPEYTIKTDTY